MKKFIVILLLLNLKILGVFNFNEELKWNWQQIDTNNISFPKNFLFGIGTSEYQVSGSKNCPNANWATFEDKKNFFGHGTIENGDKSGKACDHWNLYKQDIALLKDLGVDSYRFSIEWSCIEPQEGVYDQKAIQHYHDLCDALIENNIIPMITLYHFTHPQWFEKKGAFEEENIKYFVNFCEKIFQEFQNKVNFWVTINEPGVLVFQGYTRAVTPPQKKSLKKAGIVTKNLLQAHVEVYRTLKKISNANAQIGLVHNIFQFEPYHVGNKLESVVANYVNHIFHDAITDFLINKKLHFNIPLFVNVTYELENKNEQILDFIGLNYYSHSLINIFSSKGYSFRKDEIPTDMPYSIYAEGLYRAIASVSRLGVPIYITENGIADAQDDRREIFLKRYLYALSKAINDGYDVRGYFYWSLIDNFEWDYGFAKKFGLYQVDYNTLERKQRQSAQYYKNVIKEFKLKNVVQNIGQIVKDNINTVFLNSNN